MELAFTLYIVILICFNIMALVIIQNLLIKMYNLQKEMNSRLYQINLTVRRIEYESTDG